MLEIAEKLVKLASLYKETDALQVQKDELIAQVLPPEIKARLEEIEIEFSQKADGAKASIDALEAEIKNDTLAHGETVKASGFVAVWSQGRVSWDSKGLTEYSQNHADILQYKKQGEPSVSIRRDQAKQDLSK